jgi:hypothetical protein
MTKRLKTLLIVMIALSAFTLVQYSALPLIAAGEDKQEVAGILVILSLPLFLIIIALVRGFMLKSKEAKGIDVPVQKKIFAKKSVKAAFILLLVAPAVLASLGGIVLIVKSCASFAGTGSRESGVTAVFGVISIFFSDRTLSTIWALVGPLIMLVLAFQLVQWLIKKVYVIIEEDF